MDKKKCPVFESGQFFLADQKNEKLTGQLVGQETDQNHMDVPMVSELFGWAQFQKAVKCFAAYFCIIVLKIFNHFD